MKLLRLVAASLTLCLCAADTAFASPLTDTFTIFDLSGPLAGNTYTGSFTWDPAVSDNLTAFSTDFPSWVVTGATLPDFIFAYFAGTGIDLAYIPSPTGNPDAFAITLGNIYYGVTVTPGQGINGSFENVGEGTVTYGPIPGGATPEPRTFLLLATGLAGMLGAVRRRVRNRPS